MKRLGTLVIYFMCMLLLHAGNHPPDSSRYYKHQGNYRIRYKPNSQNDDSIYSRDTITSRFYKSNFNTFGHVPVKRKEAHTNMETIPLQSQKRYKHQF